MRYGGRKTREKGEKIYRMLIDLVAVQRLLLLLPIV